MKRNLGTMDRVIRTVVLAPLLIVVGVVVGPVAVLSWVLYALATVLIATSAVSFCPLYSLVGASTCPLESRERTPMTTAR